MIARAPVLVLAAAGLVGTSRRRHAARDAGCRPRRTPSRAVETGFPIIVKLSPPVTCYRFDRVRCDGDEWCAGRRFEDVAVWMILLPWPSLFQANTTKDKKIRARTKQGCRACPTQPHFSPFLPTLYQNRSTRHTSNRVPKFPHRQNCPSNPWPAKGDFHPHPSCPDVFVIPFLQPRRSPLSRLVISLAARRLISSAPFSPVCCNLSPSTMVRRIMSCPRSSSSSQC